MSRTHLGTKREAQRLDSYYSTLTHEGGLSPASVRHVHAVLRGSLGQGVKWGWSASPPKIRRNEINPQSVAVTRKLLDSADEHDPELELDALLRVFTVTGARRGEVCGLRWSDLDTGSRNVVHPAIGLGVRSPTGTGRPEARYRPLEQRTRLSKNSGDGMRSRGNVGSARGRDGDQFVPDTDGSTHRQTSVRVTPTAWSTLTEADSERTCTPAADSRTSAVSIDGR